MKKNFSVFLIFFGTIGFLSCGEADYEKAKIKFGIMKYEKQSEICDSTGCAKIVLEYPAIKTSFNSAVKDSLEAYIMNTLLENYSQQLKLKSLDEMAKVFMADYVGAKKDFPDYTIPWEINNTISVIYNSNSIVSFQSELYHFTGGAHGNSGVYFSNFNSQDGSKLLLSDLMNSNYKSELNKIAEKIFRKEKKLDPSASLEAEGFWFADNKFSLNENFGIKNDGLVFYFNFYEVAPYAMGPTEIRIPYSEIKSLIKQEGLLNKVLDELTINN
ncbi:MAG: DUF3298 and DUF4163 domain-containing protein [Ignavibacteriaceae bacterium]|nr:DUF3298 and DUF4163 domain-containing protein [Ignavibacteriaceae bacterium]